MLIVQKFGGKTLAGAEGLLRAAEIAERAYQNGSRVVVVVSARGDTTDRLLSLAHDITPEPDLRELDALLATGEQASAAMMAIELRRRGLPAQSMTGWQLGIHTDSEYGNAAIQRVDTARARRELGRGGLIVAAGFQGVDAAGAVTTLGRDGSDTSAVALAAALEADRCEIYTDVDGVFTADPRRTPAAQRLERVSWGEMRELTALGSQVLHDRSARLAEERRVELIVRSCAPDSTGTRIGDYPPKALTGVARQGGSVSLVGAAADAAAAERMLSALARSGVPVTAMARSPLSLTAMVPEANASAAAAALHKEFFET